MAKHKVQSEWTLSSVCLCACVYAKLLHYIPTMNMIPWNIVPIIWYDNE